MVVGFNHNFTYKGAVYHIQTEDSGRKSPTIVTLLYRGGTILASRKTSYADIARVDNLEQVVEDLMKEQHKGMLRSLKNGEFDETIARHDRGASADQHVVAPAVVPSPPPSAQPSPPTPSSPTGPAIDCPLAPPVSPAAPSVSPAAPSVSPAAPSVSPAAPPSTAEPRQTSPPVATPPPSPAETSLDEIILSYLIGKEK